MEIMASFALRHADDVILVEHLASKLDIYSHCYIGHVTGAPQRMRLVTHSSYFTSKLLPPNIDLLQLSTRN